MRQVAGRTARCLKEVAAKVHCVTGAMVAVVPKAPGVKVRELAGSVIKKRFELAERLVVAVIV